MFVKVCSALREVTTVSSRAIRAPLGRPIPDCANGRVMVYSTTCRTLLVWIVLLMSERLGRLEASSGYHRLYTLTPAETGRSHALCHHHLLLLLLLLVHHRDLGSLTCIWADR